MIKNNCNLWEVVDFIWYYLHFPEVVSYKKELDRIFLVQKVKKGLEDGLPYHDSKHRVSDILDRENANDQFLVAR